MSTLGEKLRELERLGYHINLVYKNKSSGGYRNGAKYDSVGIAYYFNVDDLNVACWFSTLGMQINPRKDATLRENMAIYYNGGKWIL
jgi:hypothetical protein